MRAKLGIHGVQLEREQIVEQIAYQRNMKDHFRILMFDSWQHLQEQTLDLLSPGSELLVVWRKASWWQGPGVTSPQISTTS